MENNKMKGDKIMKKYIIILVIAMVSMLTVNANAQSYEFQSTSTMMSSGSSLSSEGGFQSADAYYTTTVQHYGSARKAVIIDDDDDNDDENDYNIGGKFAAACGNNARNGCGGKKNEDHRVFELIEKPHEKRRLFALF